jgi:hypothetical protein
LSMPLNLLSILAKVQSSIKALRNSWLGPGLPSNKLAALRFANIKHCLTLCGVLRDFGVGVRLLRQCCGVEYKPKTRFGACRLEGRTVGLDAL